MDFLDGLRAFVAVVETGSFTAAAQRLGVSNKLTSKHVAALEKRLGRHLLYRTTRSVSLTEDGERLLPRARDALVAVEAAETALHDPDEGLSGRLRVTAGTTFGELCVADAARAFADEHPGVRVDLVLDDSASDLVSGGFDLAVRIGFPKDSSYRMLKVGATTPRIAASPAYLEQHGVPMHPDDLRHHTVILDLNEDRPGRWTFEQDGREITVAVDGRLAFNSASTTIRQALAGHGLIRAPDVFFGPHLASGALLTVLDDYARGERTIHVLTNPAAFQSAKVEAFVTILRRELRRSGKR